MTAGAHDAGGGFSRSAGTNAARGVMVIVAAVAVGLLLMFRGIGDSSADTDAAAGDGSADTAEPGDTGQGDTGVTGATDTTLPAEEVTPETTDTTVSAPPRDPSEVRVLVLNGTDDAARIGGVAGAGTDLLKPSNYVVLDPKDADVNGPSAIFFAEGYQAEANAVAAVYGVDPAAVVQPLDPTASPIVDTQDANIVVRIGSDGVIKV